MSILEQNGQVKTMDDENFILWRFWEGIDPSGKTSSLALWRND